MRSFQRLGHDLNARELHDILSLRVAVFVVEQACPYAEIDGRDLEPTTVHRWLDDRSGIIAYLRTMPEPDGSRRIGRVVTRSDRRGGGLSARLIRAAIDASPEADTVLAAQSHLRTFYERFGYVVAGDEFTEDDIPHLPMRRPAQH